MPRNHIIQEDVLYAFELAKSVERGDTRFSDAQRQLLARGFSAHAANAHLNAHRHAGEGTAWKATISINAVRVLLEDAAAESGNKLLMALQALHLHIGYRLDRSGYTSRGLRQLEEEYHPQLMAVTQVDYSTDDELYILVQESLKDTATKRQERLRTSDPKPTKSTRPVQQFNRNPDVIAEALIRANGICENCKNHAPFNRRSDGSPYLEVHHRIPLALDGDDSVENAIALCPNCHRKAHFG